MSPGGPDTGAWATTSCAKRGRYRHFPSKAALRDAVSEHWLARMSDPLENVVSSKAPAPQRIRTWAKQLSAAKRRMARPR